jgi:ephrin-B
MTTPRRRYTARPPKCDFRKYVDPKEYSDIAESLAEFTNEVPRECVTLTCEIGEGEFGDVYAGMLKQNDEDTPVAIKLLKKGSFASDKDEFLAEASIMGQFDHVNVVKLLGVVSASNPVMIIMEYLPNKSLEQYLKLNPEITIGRQVQMMRDIANGVDYLIEKGYIHRVNKRVFI